MATGAFDEYGAWDKANDSLLRNDETIQRTGAAQRAVLGAAGAVGGFGTAVATTPACITGAGCALPILSGLGGLASFDAGWTATGELFAPYDYTQGSKVLASFSSDTYPGDVNPMKDYGTAAARAAIEAILFKGVSKYANGSGASVLVEGVEAKAAGAGAKGAADVAEVSASTEGSTGTPAWTSSEGPYSGKLSGGYPSGTTTVKGQVVDDVGDFSSGLGAKATTNAPNTPRFITDSAGNTIDLDYTKGLRETNVTVTGARGGVQYPLQGQTPDSYANLGNGHVVVYGPEGRALYDVSSSRIKVVEWNQAPNGTYFPKKGSDTKVFEGNVPQSVLDSLGLK